MNGFEEVVKTVFEKAMNEACDLAELIFISDDEKKKYIENAFKNYGDDIEAHIEGAVDEDEFLKMNEDGQYSLMIEAIKDNAEAIFDKPFNF